MLALVSFFCPKRNAHDYLALQEEHLALEVEPLVEVGFHNLKKVAAIFNGQIKAGYKWMLEECNNRGQQIPRMAGSVH